MSIKRKHLHQEVTHMDDQEEGDEPVAKKVSDDKGVLWNDRTFNCALQNHRSDFLHLFSV